MALFEKKTIIKNEIDYDKLAKAIANTQKGEINSRQLEESFVNAIHLYKEDEIRKAEKEKEERKEKWLKSIGYIDDSQVDNRLKKYLSHNINNFILLKTFVFYKREYAKDVKMSFMFMMLVCSIIFLLLELAFLVFTLVLSYYIIISKSNLLYLSLNLVLLFFAKLMHIIRLEIEQMQDKEMINMIFSSLMAFIAALFTVLAFIRG